MLEEIEAQHDDVNQQRFVIRQDKITGDQIYQMLIAFNDLYPTFCEADQKQFIRAFVERIELYPEKPDHGIWIRSITFNFPIPMNGKDLREMPLESKDIVETVVVDPYATYSLFNLSGKFGHITLSVSFDTDDTWTQLKDLWVNNKVPFTNAYMVK